jgi:hypothetical protein
MASSEASQFLVNEGQQAVERGLLTPPPGLQQRRGVARMNGNPPSLHPPAEALCG